MTTRKITIATMVACWVLAGLAPRAAARRGRKGTLVIQAMTEGTRIYVDGKFVGKTPLPRPLRLRPGLHRLKATKSGFSTMEMEFTIRPGRKTELPLELLPFSGLVKFSCNIDGAEVYVDNKMVGHTPLIRDVVVGDHQVLILKEGYNDFEMDINVKAGEKHFVEANLTPYEGISPEVAALAEAHRKKQEQVKQLEQEELNRRELTNPQQVDSAQPWYAGLHKKWWVWTIAGAVVATAVTLPLALSGSGQSGLHDHDDSLHTRIDLRR